MLPDHYLWLTWAIAFLIPWLAVYGMFPEQRKAMWWASVFTTPFGLTEPLFVPEYWNPPSLFNLAARTGFDIESLLFCFGIGGVGAVLYNILTARTTAPVPEKDRHSARHRYHRLAVMAPFLAFPVLYFLPWNVIYASIAAMAIGSLAAAWCRTDLQTKMLFSGALFLGYYTLFLTALEISSPGYIERTWNTSALSGITLAFIPVEELLFAVTFGMYWSSVYEHVTWRHLRPGAHAGHGR